LARAFAAAAARLGVAFERGVSADRLRRDGDRVTGVESSAGFRAAGTVVVCAGAWSPALSPCALPIEPVRGQIVSLDQTQPPLRTIAVGPGAYLVPKRDGRIVVGATEERAGFDCRVTAAGVAGLLASGIELVPALADSAFRDAWAGLRPVTPDGLPVVGPAPGTRGLFLAAGHGRNGVLLAPITGRLVADLVLGKALPPEIDAVSPERF
jgi:glycine oxidase